MKRNRRESESQKDSGFKIGESNYLNENCWLVKNLDSRPYKRCQYCESKFRNCLFLQYQIVSVFLIIFFIAFSFLIKDRISGTRLAILIIFGVVIIYGYFFNKSTDRLIQAYFIQAKAKKVLEELTEKLEERVGEQTREIKKAFAKVNELSRCKSELISIAAHQIKNPLVTIRGYVSLIQEGTIKEERETRETIKKIGLSSDKLIDLLNNLLDACRIEDGKIHYEFVKIEINGMLKEIIEDFQFVAERKGLNLEFQPAEKEIFVNADKYKLSQVFRNLIDNAVKYTERGFINVIVKRQVSGAGGKDKVLITVSDSGRGISKETQNKLFQRFSRAGDEKQILGAGLGLYIAKRIITDHNGKIWAESRGEGKGASFFVELNRRPNSSAS